MSNILVKGQGSVRLLAAADLHLGRSISMPYGIKKHLFSPEHAWDRLTDFAVNPENQVDVLLLAGDLFDREENLLEASLYFEAGIKKLARLNIPVIAIAGNHDWRPLELRKRLRGYPHLHLLGLGGLWESCRLQFADRIIQFDGWSFPSSHYLNNPLDLLPAPSSDCVTVGLLHGDWQNNAGSLYAPFSWKELLTSHRLVWILGHLHTPKILANTPCILSCGSLQGLDSSEQGAHGACLIDITPENLCEVHTIPMANLIWQRVSVDLTGVLENGYLPTLQAQLEEECTTPCECISLEVLWHGGGERAIREEILAKLEGTYFQVGTKHGTIDCHLRKSTMKILPEISITQLAQEESLLGQVARQILQLQNPSEEEAVRALFEEEAASYPHLELGFDLEELKEAGYKLLFALLEQRQQLSL